MSRSKIRPRRSLIFVPGNKPEWFPKALNYGADIVCVDIEDAISPDQKDSARSKTLALFAQDIPANNPECLVRINNLRSNEGVSDVQEILRQKSPPPGLMLTKVKSADEIVQLQEIFSSPSHQSLIHI